LLSAHENRLNQLLAALQSDDIVLQVRQFIIQSISEGEIHQGQVANQLGMSTRNFQRKLSHQGTSFREILAITRQEITINHMKNPQLALGEISFLVGFSSISNFNRAFKRWFGITPGAYRKGLTS
jgi:AraC-like DNA-binding protein